MRDPYLKNEPYHTATKERRARGSMEGGRNRKTRSEQAAQKGRPAIRET
jgi:hypothetical protein